MIVEVIVLVAIVLALLQYYGNRRPPNFPPGPTGVPGLGYAPFLRHPIHGKLQDLSKKYGNIFGIVICGIPVVILSDWKLIREAFNDDRLCARPSLQIFEQRCGGKQRGIVLGTGKDWMEQRRFTVKYFKNLRFGKSSMEDLVKVEIVDVISSLKKEVNHPVNMESRFTSAILNVLWHMISGERYSHDDPKLEEIGRTLVKVSELAGSQGAVFFMPWLTKWFPKISGFQGFMDAIKSTYDFLGQTVHFHKKSFDADNPRDFIDLYLKEIESTTDPESSFYKKEGEIQLLTVVQDIFLGGIESIESLLNWILLYMIMRPEVQEKVFEEIESAVGTDRLPSITDKPSLPYTEAVIAEIERVSTLAPLGGPHTASEEVKFDGYTIPKGGIVIANLWQLHNDKDYWGDPETFRPERFLNKEGAFQKNQGLNIFAVGKRQCPGELLVNDEIYLFTTALIQNFRFQTDQTSQRPTLVPKNSMLTQTEPYKLVIRDRSNRKSSL